MIVVRCASHQANLCVEVAIAGRLLADPLEDDHITCNASRFFKHMLGQHVDEYYFNLRRFIASQARSDLPAMPGPSEAERRFQRSWALPPKLVGF